MCTNDIYSACSSHTALAHNQMQQYPMTPNRWRGRSWRNDNATVITRSLHWLPIRQIIQFKTGLLGFKARLSGQYLQDTFSSHHPTTQLKSSSVHQFFKPAVNSNFASPAFSVLAPSVLELAQTQPPLHWYFCILQIPHSSSRLMVAHNTVHSHPALLIRFLILALYKLYCINVCITSSVKSAIFQWILS